MKDFIIPLLLLVFAIFTSCFNNADSNTTSPIPVVDAPIQASPSGASTPIPSTAVNTLSPIIFKDFNLVVEDMAIASPLDELEHIAGASYQVTGVDILQENNSSALRVKTRCECAENGPCCNYLHTFVYTIAILKNMYLSKSLSNLQTQIPGDLSFLQVWCYDHANLSRVVTVPWADVKSFLDGGTDGFQLWYHVTPSP